MTRKISVEQIRLVYDFLFILMHLDLAEIDNIFGFDNYLFIQVVNSIDFSVSEYP